MIYFIFLKHDLNPKMLKGCGAGTDRRKISGFICPRQSVEKHQSIHLVYSKF